MEEGSQVKSSKDEIRFPGDGAETCWNDECDSSIKCPVGCLVEWKVNDDDDDDDYDP